MIATTTQAPWYVGPRNESLTSLDLTLLFDIYVGRYGDLRGSAYSEDGCHRPSPKLLRSLASIGVLEFFDATAGGWEPGMWGARLTCLGANAVFRNDGGARLDAHGQKDINATGRTQILDGHPGCVGGWLPDGTCTDCTQKRPLDHAAYLACIDALDVRPRLEQINGPQLYCIEHGYMRTADITTTKVCRLAGTEFHDGGLFRIAPIKE